MLSQLGLLDPPRLLDGLLSFGVAALLYFLTQRRR